MYFAAISRNSTHRNKPTAESRSAARRAFTLIELLVVIAIMSILASMLFPSFSRAREQARKVVCASNLQQIGLGIAQYTQDWDERYPIGYPFWNPKSQSIPRYSLVQVVDPYIKSTQIWQCNSWQGRYTANNTFGTGNYSFVTVTAAHAGPWLIGVPNDDPTLAPLYDARSLAAANEPTKYPLLFCGSAPGQTDPPLINAHTGISDSAWSAGTGLGGTNILYADGHVKYTPVDSGRWQTIYDQAL